MTAEMKTQRQLAEEERRMYDALSVDERRGTQQGRYISAKTGATRFAVMVRSIIWHKGSEAEPLWQEIDEQGMKLNTARRIIHAARKKKISISEAIAEYKETVLLGVRGSRIAEVSRGHSPAKPPKIYGPWQKIREACAEIVSEAGLDEHEREFYLKVVIAEVESVMTTFQSRLLRARNVSVSWSKVRQACTMLSVPIPKRSKPCDLKLARKHQRSVLKVSHPDVVGDESGRDAYQAVVDAYDVLVAYNDSLGSAAAQALSSKVTAKGDGFS